MFNGIISDMQCRIATVIMRTITGADAEGVY